MNKEDYFYCCARFVKTLSLNSAGHGPGSWPLWFDLFWDLWFVLLDLRSIYVLALYLSSVWNLIDPHSFVIYISWLLRPRLVSMSCQQCICVCFPVVSPCLSSLSVFWLCSCLVSLSCRVHSPLAWSLRLFFLLSSLCVLSSTFPVSHVSMSVYRWSLGHVHKS